MRKRNIKEDNRLMKSQSGDAEKEKLIEQDKRIGIDEIIKQNNGKS